MNPKIAKDKTFSKWVVDALKVDDTKQGVNKFRENMWRKWKALYHDPGFIYHDKKKGGVFSVTSRTKYEIGTKAGTMATYSAGLEKEDKYSRDIFNQKKIRLNNTPNSGNDQELIFFSYEAPLLRVKTEKDRQFRISADLVALSDQDIVILETKLPGGDSLDKAILQAYGYSFFLACHLASNHQNDVIDHIKESLSKFQTSADAANNMKAPRLVQYMIVAPSQYFYENLIVSKKVAALLSELDAVNCKLEEPPKNCKLPVNPKFAGFVTIENNHLCFKNFDLLMQYQSDVCSWQGFDRSLSYADAERLAQIRCKRQSGLFSQAAREDGEYIFKGKTYIVPYCLPNKCKEENIFEPIRKSAYQFFKNRISWHSKGENHLLSSQAYCVNFLFPFAKAPDALKSLLKNYFPNIKEMLPVEDDMYVTFEWNGEKGKNYLKEKGDGQGRGEMATYPDAAVKFKKMDGTTQLVLIEWKYTERYKEKNKAEGEDGKRRLDTYKQFCDPLSDCIINLPLIDTDLETAIKALFYEPFYQLFREQLLAQEMEKSEEDIHTVSILHICPEENDAYINNVTSPALRKIFPGESVLDIWKKLVRIESRFTSTSQEILFQNFQSSNFFDFKEWTTYMSTRYRLGVKGKP